jgi:hypothetical protein
MKDRGPAGILRSIVNALPKSNVEDIQDSLATISKLFEGKISELKSLIHQNTEFRVTLVTSRKIGVFVIHRAASYLGTEQANRLYFLHMIIKVRMMRPFIHCLNLFMKTGNSAA